jgi:hypothetical protein
LNSSFAKALLFLAFALPLVAQAQQEPPASASTAEAAPSDQQLAAARCPISEEKFLPGDYYYCIGAMNYGEHNYRNTMRFFTIAASWASKPAQYVLGIMALNGDHQPVNRALALAWWTLAAERPQSRFQGDYDVLNKAASREEHAQANALLATMRPIYGDEVAARRAEARYVSGMQWLRWVDSGGSSICLAGLGGMSGQVPSPSGCPSVQQVVATIDKLAGTVFDGWTGHVVVGPLQRAEAPSTGDGGK